MWILFSFFIFCLGAAAGSFINTLIFRLSQKEDFFFSRSRCLFCNHSLTAKDLIPILSFIFLGGRCRYCRKSISWQYPIVETVTGLLFLLIFNFQFSIFNPAPIDNFQTILELVFLWVISSLLMVIFIYDWKYYLIPDEIVYPAIAITFLYHLFGVLGMGQGEAIGNWKLEIGNLTPLLSSLFIASLASAFFLSIYLISRGRWLGFGDVKLVFLIGFLLGFPKILVALFSTYLLGAAMGITLILAGRKKLKDKLPFGPFLVTGTFLALFWGEPILRFYLRLFF